MPKSQLKPQKVSSKKHPISKHDIPDGAHEVLKKLHDNGFRALLVGGCVRDLLLGKKPKDFDVTTDATPEEVAELFKRNARIIGRRFKIVHVRFGRLVLEVATFRASPKDSSTESGSGRLITDNIYGTIEEDALRRDFTVNALYYDYADRSILDFTNGLEDLKNNKLALIGDPEVRYREDPVRMLRAIRFAAKLDFKIDKQCARPIPDLAYLLVEIPSARLFDESVKLFSEGYSRKVFELLNKYNLFSQLYPQTLECMEEDDAFVDFIYKALESTDNRVKINKPITPAYIYAVFLWWPVYKKLRLNSNGMLPPPMKIHAAAQGVIVKQLAITAIPKRFTIPMSETYALQSSLEFNVGAKALRLLEKKRFRMAYDFLGLRAEVGQASQKCFEFWTEIQESDDAKQLDMVNKAANNKRPSKRKRKPRSKPRSGT